MSSKLSNENNSNKARFEFKGLLHKLVSPLAVGIYLAIISALIAKSYYDGRLQPSRSLFMQALQAIDQNFIDARFRLRGPKPVDPQIAILAIDGRSLDIVGRWPWPRAILARALQNTFHYGAKIIAADAVWSEPTRRPALHLVEVLRRETRLPGVVNADIQKILNKTDSDKKFADFVGKNKTKFILGGFFKHGVGADHPGYIDPCYDAIYHHSPLSNAISEQSKPLVVIAENEIDFPQQFTKLYEYQLAQIAASVRNRYPIPKTAAEQYVLNKKVLNAELNFCDSDFLIPQRDPVAKILKQNWAQLKSQVAGLTARTFEDWRADFQSSAPANFVLNAKTWKMNIPEIQSRGENTGFFNADLDSDGIIRNTYLIARTGSRYMPSLALQTYLTATDRQTEIQIGNLPDLSGVVGVKHFAITDHNGNTLFDIPVNPSGAMMINYAGPDHMYPYASIADMLDNSNPNVTVTQRILKRGKYVLETRQVSKASFFKNKILFLGATAIGINDIRDTPFGGDYPGVEIHANILGNLLQHDFLRHDAREHLYMPWFLLILGVCLAGVLAQFGALTGIVITGAILASLLFIDKQFLFGQGLVVSIELPIIEVLMMYLVLTFYKYFTEERAKRELRGTFSKYVSPAIVNEVLKDPKNLELGGRKERITVFFSDVRGFTTLSEKLDPLALSELLNSYLTPMTEIVFKNKGTLDKYMGDAIMAFFGAPIHYADHGHCACRCALQSLECLAKLNDGFRKKGRTEINIGIGLNTGDCNVGNMGSQTVRNYTVMGDAVNLASRLEGINKTYGTHIIISESTYADVKNDFFCRELDWVRVKGKIQPVKIYELLGENQVEKTVLKMADYFRAGYELYHEKNFKSAIAQFEQAVQCRPDDLAAKLYVERCQKFLATPPPIDWDGVFVMKTK